MRDHEQLIAAARASWVAAHELALPSEQPERGIEHDQAKHLKRIEKALAAERKVNQAMRAAVIAAGDKIAIVVRSLIALVLVGGAIAYYLIQRNTQAIRTSCTLLTNAVLQSGGGGTGQAPTSPAAAAQRDNTAILVAAIARKLLTREERARMRTNAAVIADAGGVVAIPDCDEIARHPDRVRELLLTHPREDE